MSSNRIEKNGAIPFNDIAIQWREIEHTVRPSIERIWETSAFCLGPDVEAFEHEIADYLGVPYAIGVNSGTSALHLAVVAAGLGLGDEVFVPAHTFIATCWGLIYANVKPVLCDVDDATGTIDAADAERRITSKCRAIIAVHLYGQPAAMDAVQRLANAHGLIVIEDNAQAIGARWNNQTLGSIGHFGCFSFYPGKNLGAAGEGGLVTTSDAGTAARIRALRHHGQSERHIHAEVGYNYRMEALQGAVLRAKLKRLDAWTARRRELAARYQKQLADLPLRIPQVVNQDHVWHLFVVRTPARDALRDHLTAARIETGLHYPIPLHRQPALAFLGADTESYPQSDRWANEGLSLPLFYGMTDEQVDRVVTEIRTFFG